MKSSMKTFSLNMHSPRSPRNYRTLLKKGTGAIALSLMLLTFSTHTHAQQSLQLGVLGGGNFYKVGGRSFDGKIQPGFRAGVYGELNFTSKWSIQPELVWSQTVTKTSDQFSQIYPGNGASGQQ